MKKILFINLLLIFICPIKDYAQQKPFNCLVLEEIIFKIDSIKEYITLSDYISGKYFIEKNDLNGKEFIRINTDYKSDRKLDSILSLKNINDILYVRFDSLFYLAIDNIILDTFRFFTPSCNETLNGRNITIINDVSKIPKDKKYNVLIVTSLNTYQPYSYIENRRITFSMIKLLRWNYETKKYKGVMFLYHIERNIPMIKEYRIVD